MAEIAIAAILGGITVWVAYGVGARHVAWTWLMPSVCGLLASGLYAGLRATRSVVVGSSYAFLLTAAMLFVVTWVFRGWPLPAVLSEVSWLGAFLCLQGGVVFALAYRSLRHTL